MTLSKLSTITVFFIALGASACGGGNSSPTSPSSSTVNVPYSQTDLRVGTGLEATGGRTATVNYSLWLYSTTAADNKGTLVQVGGPFPFVVNGGGTIVGFNQAVLGMKVGGLRRAVVPPNLGYGSQAQQGIPPNSTLIFEIELLSLQ